MSLKMMSVGMYFVLTILAPIFTFSAPLSDASFPLKVSANGRYLIDAVGNPVLLNGDTAWFLVYTLSRENVELYLENRRLKGFNAILLQFHDFIPGSSPRKLRSNYYGNPPFDTPSDFSTPNRAYHDHIAYVISTAKNKGMVVIVNPAYTGYSGNGTSAGDGILNEIIANGLVKNRNYGRYIGNRFKSFNNIIWQAVGDMNPPSGGVAEKNWLEILMGIKEYTPNILWSAHYQRFSTARNIPAFASHMQIDNTYGGNRSYIQTLKAYNRTTRMPTFYNEGYYENASSGRGTPAMQRAQAYWAILSGASGHVFGSHYIYSFGLDLNPATGQPYDWVSGMNRQPSKEMTYVAKLFEGRAWYNLIPDQSHTLVTSGYGTFGTDSTVAGGDYVTAARTSDGRLAMAYIPSTGTATRAITVNLSQMSGAVTGRWYNPTTSSFTTISGSPFANSGSKNFTTPGNNGTGTNDWILVLEASSTSTTPPVGPTNLSGSALSSSQVKIMWSDNSTNETGYEIDRATVSVGPWTQIATVGSNITTYTNSGLSASTTYYYRVRATNSAGDSINSNIVSVTTPIASGLTNLVVNGNMESVKWTSGSYAGPNVTSWATDQYVSATHSMKTSGTAYYNWIKSSTFVVTPGKTYTASVWVKTSLTAGTARLNVRWYNSANQEVRWSSAVGGSTSGTTAWKKVFATLPAAPADAVKAEIQLRVGQDGVLATGTVWFDNASIVEGSSPGQ